MAGHNKTKGFLPVKTPGGVLQVIQGYLEDLRNSEKKVAQYVLTRPAKVIYQSISELAENAGTSEPTVIRFCRALGFSGFQDLKIQLAQDLVPQIKNIH
ncbi:MAG: MurR/RpiR family transcriptional regulator, partial [Deltaproteobacteria bacterium]|nr:MurR/RpiR family transcriptional regulator [Deltaproteobacteria bacterium]